eukprot:GGOE01019996.1.p1 GENE.GGOE01019996.1~~GGOE01019996.1.p1  ORF type:complete len:635 (-),score=133.20 GGOE01019996.1:206-2110(-)
MGPEGEKKATQSTTVIPSCLLGNGGAVDTLALVANGLEDKADASCGACSNAAHRPIFETMANAMDGTTTTSCPTALSEPHPLQSNEAQTATQRPDTPTSLPHFPTTAGSPTGRGMDVSRRRSDPPSGKWGVGKLREWISRSASPKLESRHPPVIHPHSLRQMGLPPKSDKEARDHAKKIEELRRDQERLARKKEAADAQRVKQLAAKDAFIQRAKDTWKTQIIPDWEAQHKTRHARKLWLQGIPDSVRKDVWPLAIGNALSITPELYEILKAKAEESRKTRPPLSPLSSSSSAASGGAGDEFTNLSQCPSIEHDALSPVASLEPHSGGAGQHFDRPPSDEPLSCSSSSSSSSSSADVEAGRASEIQAVHLPPGRTAEVPNADSSNNNAQVNHRLPLSLPSSKRLSEEPLSKENTASLIQLDLRRTFPQLQFFREGPEHDNLYMVLDAYVHYRPDVGYVQGMTYLAAILLLYMDCYSAFVCLVNMLSKYHFLSFFRMDLREMNVHLLTFDLLMKDQMPVVHETFHRHGLRVEFYCIDWFVTLYSKSLPLDIAARIWDLFLMDPDYLYLAGLGIIKLFIQKFTGADFEDMFEFITHLPKKMNEDAFFHGVASFGIAKRRIKAIKAEAERIAPAKMG